METVDYMRKYRVFPVLFSFLYAYLMLRTFEWYTSLPMPDVGQSGFAGAVMAAGAAWFKFYVNSGNNTND